MRAGESGHAEQGFSLVETLVASAIIATMTALTFQLVAANAQSARMMAERRTASMVARSALDLVSATDLRGSGPRRGEMAGVLWTAEVKPYAAGAFSGDAQLNLITVTVTNPGERRPLFRLRTLKVET